VVAFGAAAAFALALLFGVLAYLQTASGRGLLAAKVSAWVSGELLAELRIDRVDVLANDRLVISGATLFDAKGRAVLRVRNVTARLDAWTLLTKLVSEPTVRVELPDVRVESLELGLYRTETGDLSLIEAFSSRNPSLTPGKSGKGPHILLPKIGIESVSVRTDVSGLSQATVEARAFRLSFGWSPELFALGLASDDVRVSRALPLDGQAQLSAQIRIPGTTEATLDGSVGPLPIHASFSATGRELALKVSSASLPPDAMRALVPAWPLYQPLSARVDLAGRLESIRAKVELEADATRVTAEGTVSLSPSIKGELSLVGRQLDARLFAPAAARTALSADAKLEFSLEPTAHAELSARVAKGDLFGAPLPETTVHAVYDGSQITGTAASSDPTLPVTADFGVSTQGALAVHVRIENLDLVALEPYGLKAQGEVDLDATAELAESELAAKFEARIRALRIAPLHAQTTLVRGKVYGPITRLEQLGVELQADGTKLVVGPVELPAWALSSKGAIERQSVSVRAGPETEPTLQASTTLALDHGLGLTETQIEAGLNGVKHRLELRSAHFAAQVIDLRDLRWQIGAGSLAGSALISPARKQVELELRGLEAEAVLKTFGLAANTVRGQLNAQFQLEERGRARQGQLQGTFVDGAVPALGAVQAEFSATITDAHAKAQVAFSVPELGQGKLSAYGALGEAPITLDSLAAMPGEIRLDVHDIDLAAAGLRWWPARAIALSGLLDGSARLTKLDAQAPVTVSYELKTRELGLRSSRTEGDGSLLHAELESHGEFGATESSLQLELKDRAGTWIHAQIAQSLGWPALLRELRSSSLALLLNAPLRAEISARPRSLQFLGPGNPLAVNGEVAAQFSVTGSARQPEVEGSLSATGLGTGEDPQGKLGLTFDYSAEREQYSFKARYADRKRAKLELDGGGHWGWFGAGLGRDWSARAVGRIEQIEIGPLGEMLGVPVSGEAAGHAAFSASATEFEAKGELSLTQLALERHSLGRGSLELRVHRGLAEAKLSVAGANAKLDLSGELGLCWDGGPCIDPKRGGSVDVHIRNYQLTTLAPLLRSVASDVRGPINGFVVLGWDPADATGKRKTRLRADASVTGGSVTLIGGTGSIQCLELRAFGGEREDDALLDLTLSGCAGAKQTNLKAEAQVRWNGPLPARVDAKLLQLDQVPVSFDGVALGKATVDAKARPIQLTLDLAGAARAIEVTIPALGFELPAKDDTDLVDLAEDPAIQVTDVKAPPASAVAAAESNPWSVSVRLGNSVKVTQAAMRVPVTGTLSQSPDGLLDGRIVFPEGGEVPQLGQVFRLKRGSVRFEHQPLNEGVLNIEASTRTVDGVAVDLLVSGTIENPVIRFRSDPPRSESEIVGLLLGVQGSSTGANTRSTSSSSSAQQGQELRGGATALAMNQLVRGSALAGLQFGSGQTSKGDSVSTVSVRAGNTVWLEGRTVRTSTQRAASSGVQSSGVIDWRFARGFSLRTQLGNISGLELRWSHRY
jgi:translocation and assembly module TamB